MMERASVPPTQPAPDANMPDKIGKQVACTTELFQ